TFEQRFKELEKDLIILAPVGVDAYIKKLDALARSRCEPRVLKDVAMTAEETAAGTYLQDAAQITALRMFVQDRVFYKAVVRNAGKQDEVQKIIDFMFDAYAKPPVETEITYSERAEHLRSMLEIPAFHEDRVELFIGLLKIMTIDEVIEQAREERFDLAKAKEICRIAIANQLLGNDEPGGAIERVRAEMAKLEMPALPAQEYLAKVDELAAAMRDRTLSTSERGLKVLALVELIEDWERSLVTNFLEENKDKVNVVDLAKAQLSMFKTRLDAIQLTLKGEAVDYQNRVQAVRTAVIAKDIQPTTSAVPLGSALSGG
ncbi:hypothetical protein KAT92_00605, partial [Candidatus Babeliales bacterium]|nr:hypothetical protein [Candidatus Babeliales bacterium]